MKLLHTSDYILIAVGLLMLPIFIGLVILGVAIWRIGSRMERADSDTAQSNANASQPSNKQYSESPQPTQSNENSIHEDNMLDFAPQFLTKRYKLKQYSEDTLEDGK